MQYDFRRAAPRRLPQALAPFVFAFYMAAIMSFMMCLVITYAECGMRGDYLENVLNAYRIAMPAAFLCILVVRPVVLRLVALSTCAD